MGEGGAALSAPLAVTLWLLPLLALAGGLDPSLSGLGAAAGRPGRTVRLACIDAPETAQSPYGQQARTYLQQRLPISRDVSLKIKTTDRYGRSVAEVISDININLALVEDGQAFAYRQYLSGCDAKEYLDAEYRASRRRYWIWQVPGGITRPWDFRRGRRSAVIPDGTTPGGRRYRCKEIGSYARAQELLRQGHSYLDGNGDGEACEALR
ncbi:thermonuclease family protein [Synechococcus sp. CS-1330]|nr:thermonuclease family protein [Synechococcus sp. CS-1330]